MIYIVIMVLATLPIFPIRFHMRNALKNKYRILEKFLIFISFIIALLPMGLRYGIGTDYFFTYLPHFYGTAKGRMKFSEIGFNLINKVIFDLTGDYKVLFFVTSALFLVFIYKGIIENSNNLVISILIVFLGQSYFYAMNIVRQAIAMAIIFYSFKYLKKDSKIIFSIFCILASFIHSSALIMILLVFIYNINMENKKKILFIIMIIIFQPVISNLIKLVIAQTKYNWYYNSIFNTGEAPLILIILNLIIFIMNIFYSNSKQFEDKEYKILSNINYIGVCLLILSSSIPLINRLVRYFTIFQILLIPKIFEKEKNQKIRLILKCVILGLLFATMYYQIIILGGEGVYPYKSIFNQ